MTTRIHLSLPITDLERSQAFYRTLFGQAASKEKPDYANFRLDEPPIHLALVHDPVSAGKSGGHFGIELADHDTLANWQTRAQQGGLTVEDEPGAVCCYATGDKFWLNDPDGYRWEVWVRTGAAPVMHPSGQCCTA